MSANLVVDTSRTTMLSAIEARGTQILAQNAENDRTGLYYKTYTIGKGNATPKEADGVYFLVGANPNIVNNMTYDNTTLLEEYARQECNSDCLYPRCSIMKFDNKISGYSDFVDLRTRIDFINLIFNKYEQSVPDEISVGDFVTLITIYEQWKDQENPILKQDLDKQLNFLVRVIASGKTQEEFEEEHGTAIVGDEALYKELMSRNAKRLKETSIYNPISEKCVDMPKLLKNGGEIISLNIREEYLKDIEKDLEMSSVPKYSIVKESVPALMDEGVVHWHMLSFSAAYKTEVCAIVHKHELGLQDRAKEYYEGELETAYSIPISIYDFEQFEKYFKDINLDYYLDMSGLYQPSDTSFVGIVVEDQESYKRMLNIVKVLLDSKSKGTLISDEDKGVANHLKKDNAQYIDITKNEHGFIKPRETQNALPDKSR